MIAKIIDFSDVFTIKTSQGTDLSKRSVVLQDTKTHSTFVCSALGDNAETEYKKDALCIAEMWFSARPYNGSYFQDVSLTFIHLL